MRWRCDRYLATDWVYPCSRCGGPICFYCLYEHMQSEECWFERNEAQSSESFKVAESPNQREEIEM